MPTSAQPEPAPAKPNRRWWQYSIVSLFVAVTVVDMGCGSPNDTARQQRTGEVATVTPAHIADAKDAAVVAARLANEKCKRLWDAEPFTPELYPARFQNGLWHWGEYDPAGPGGFSAEVMFAPDGGNTHVRINWSTDADLESDPADESEENWDETYEDSAE